MKLAHTITLSCFVKKGEDEESLRQALIGMVPLDLELEKIKVHKTVAEGFENKIIILEITLEKESHTTKFIDHLKKELGSAQCETIASQENRVDDECYFYLRLDKKKLLEKKYVVTDSGDCIHVKMSIAAFPKKREAAVAVVKKIFA